MTTDHNDMSDPHSGGRSGPPADQPTETAAPLAAVRLPKKIGHYHVKRVLASGGMGTVYEVTQEKQGRLRNQLRRANASCFAQA